MDALFVMYNMYIFHPIGTEQTCLFVQQSTIAFARDCATRFRLQPSHRTQFLSVPALVNHTLEDAVFPM